MDTIYHYLALIRRRFWVLAALFPIMAVLAMVGLHFSGKMKSDNYVSATLGMHQPLQEGPERPYTDRYGQKLEFLKSRKILTQVVKNLSLNFTLKGFKRRTIFKSVKIDEFALNGNYQFIIDPDGKNFRILLTNPEIGYENEEIRSGSVDEIALINLPGANLEFNKPYLKAPFSFEFSILSERKATDELLKRYSVSRPGGIAAQHFTISLMGFDGPLITETINYIADFFIEQDVNLRKERTNETTSLIQQQLNTANQQRAASLARLNSFLRQNPDVALDQQLEQTVSKMMQLESGKVQNTNSQSEGTKLLQDYSVASGEDKLNVVGEIISFLMARGVTSASFLNTEYTSLLAQQNTLARTHAKNHPNLVENQEKLDRISLKAVENLNEYIVKVRTNQQKEQQDIQMLSQKVASLPYKYVKLAELKRVHQTHSESYSQLLSKLNEAKVASSVEVAEFFVMDYAIEPIPQSRLMYWAKLILIGLFLGLALSLGPVILLESMKSSASSPFEMQKFTNLHLIESLPFIVSLNHNQRMSERTYPYIVESGADDDENMQECLRSLVTKLMMSFAGQTQKGGLVFTSLEPGAGKSTISANVAAIMAKKNIPTLIIDGDLRKGRVAEVFHLNNQFGLTNLLSENFEDFHAAIDANIIKSKINNLSIITSGPHVDNAYELLSQSNMVELLEHVMAKYQVIILDSPPLGVCVDSLATAELFSKYVLIAEAGKTNLNVLSKKIQEFPVLNNKVAGVVLNKVQKFAQAGYSNYSNYRKLSYKPISTPVTPGLEPKPAQTQRPASSAEDNKTEVIVIRQKSNSVPKKKGPEVEDASESALNLLQKKKADETLFRSRIDEKRLQLNALRELKEKEMRDIENKTRAESEQLEQLKRRRMAQAAAIKKQIEEEEKNLNLESQRKLLANLKEQREQEAKEIESRIRAEKEQLQKLREDANAEAADLQSQLESEQTKNALEEKRKALEEIKAQQEIETREMETLLRQKKEELEKIRLSNQTEAENLQKLIENEQLNSSLEEQKAMLQTLKARQEKESQELEALLAQKREQLNQLQNHRQSETEKLQKQIEEEKNGDAIKKQREILAELKIQKEKESKILSNLIQEEKDLVESIRKRNQMEVKRLHEELSQEKLSLLGKSDLRASTSEIKSDLQSRRELLAQATEFKIKNERKKLSELEAKLDTAQTATMHRLGHSAQIKLPNELSEGPAKNIQSGKLETKPLETAGPELIKNGENSDNKKREKPIEIMEIKTKPNKSVPVMHTIPETQPVSSSNQRKTGDSLDKNKQFQPPAEGRSFPKKNDLEDRFKSLLL